MAELVRSVARSLNLLTTLNGNNGASLNWLAKATGLSRGTTYRMLETFITEGYAIKDEASRGYWLTEKVQGLSDGYAETGWITSIAQPHLLALGRKVVWPLSLCVPSGTDMVVKTTTDLDSPLTMELISAGLRMPILFSAAGKAYLAHCSADERQTLESLIRRSPAGLDGDLLAELEKLDIVLKTIRDDGHASVEGTYKVSNIAVPVITGDTVLACIVIRFYTSAMSLDEAIEIYCEPLKRAATEIGDAYATERYGNGPA